MNSARDRRPATQAQNAHTRPRNPLRACRRPQVPNKKLYLITTDTHRYNNTNRKKYTAIASIENPANTNSWADKPMLFMPLTFPKSGLCFAEPPEQLTACPDEVQLIEPPRAPPVAALLRNAYGEAYFTDFGIPATVTNAVKKEVRRFKVSSDSTEPAKQLRVLLLKQYPSLRLPKKLKVYRLHDYVKALKRLKVKPKEFPTCYRKYLKHANEYFLKGEGEKDEHGIAARIASLFPGVSAELILECQKKSDYNLKSASVSGGSIHEKGKAISDALKALAIDYQHRPVNDSITEKVRIIDECHEYIYA